MKVYLCQWHPTTRDYVGPGVCRAGHGYGAGWRSDPTGVYTSEFRTASHPSVHAAQLRTAGWTIARKHPTQPGVLIAAPEKKPLDIEGTIVLCPAHRPLGRMESIALEK